LAKPFSTAGLFGSVPAHSGSPSRFGGNRTTSRASGSGRSRSAYRRNCRSCGDEIILVNMASHWVAFNASNGDTHDCMPTKRG
jgi:hypothetical protein